MYKNRIITRPFNTSVILSNHRPTIDSSYFTPASHHHSCTLLRTSLVVVQLSRVVLPVRRRAQVMQRVRISFIFDRQVSGRMGSNVLGYAERDSAL